MKSTFKDKIQFFKIKIKLYLSNPQKIPRWLYYNFQLLLNFINPLPRLYLIIYDVKIKTKTKFEDNRNLSSEKTKIYLTYFSCRKDFEYLFLSLKSLEKLNSEYIGKVYLYIDKHDSLFEEQIAKLEKGFSLNIILRKTKYRMSWGGPRLIINELTAFEEISSEIKDNDFIAKVDSDTLFFSDKIFKDVVETNYDLIGREAVNAEEINFKYSAGGCYFLRKPIINKIANYPIYKVFIKTSGIIKEKISNCPEDAVIFHLVKIHTTNIKLFKYTNGYLKSFKLGGISKEALEFGCILHFIGIKEKMNEIAKKLDIID